MPDGASGNWLMDTFDENQHIFHQAALQTARFHQNLF